MPMERREARGIGRGVRRPHQRRALSIGAGVMAVATAGIAIVIYGSPAGDRQLRGEASIASDSEMPGAETALAGRSHVHSDGTVHQHSDGSVHPSEGQHAAPAAEAPGTESDRTLVEGTRTAQVSVVLAEDCVRPGDEQTVTIRLEPPLEGIGVAYHATYADDRTAVMDGYYGGNNGGQTDEAGSWTDTWAIDPTAPEGPVVVDAITFGHSGGHQYSGSGKSSFRVAGVLGACS